jgi:DNA-binding CsgD family transcriptional regulator
MTETEINQAIDLRNQGMRIAEIAKILKMDSGTVSRHLKHRGIKTTSLLIDRIPEDTQKVILEFHDHGYSTKYIGLTTGYPRSSIINLLKSHGREFVGKTGLSALEAIADKVIQEYQENSIGCREIALRFGFHEGTVSNFFAARNLLKKKGAQEGAENPQYKSRSEEYSKIQDQGKYWSRQIVKSSLGCELPKGYVIHHMDENPLNQSISNLWIFPDGVKHVQYHQQQLSNLASGALKAPSQLALENDALWLPQLIALKQSQPDISQQSLYKMAL